MTEPFAVQLSGELGLRGIEALKTRIVDALATHDAIAIDTADVESADASAIQLLIAAQKTANAEGKAMSLRLAAAGPLARALVALGLISVAGAALVPETATWSIDRATT